MSTPLLITRIVDQPLSVAGVVRDPDLAHSVTELQHVGHPTAGEVTRELAESFTARKDLPAVPVRHRIGLLATWPRLAQAASATAARPTSPARNSSMK